MLRHGIISIAFLCASAMLCAGDVTDWVAGLGGKAQRDAAGNVVAVNLRGTWINDVEMVDVGASSEPGAAGPLAHPHHRRRHAAFEARQPNPD